MNAGKVQLTQKRSWRLHQGLLQVGRCSSKCLVKIIGVASWLMLLHRPLLGIFCAVYRFAECGAAKVRSIWPSVKRELGILQALLPFCCKDLRLAKSETIYASDACGSWFAVARAEGAGAHAQAALAVDGRWRFREHGVARSACEVALSMEDA